MARKIKVTAADIAPVAVAAAGILGGASFLLIGMAWLIFSGYGAHAGSGVMNSQPVVLGVILIPPVAPLLGWLFLRLRRTRAALASAIVGIVPAVLLLGTWLWSVARHAN